MTKTRLQVLRKQWPSTYGDLVDIIEQQHAALVRTVGHVVLGPDITPDCGTCNAVHAALALITEE